MAYPRSKSGSSGGSLLWPAILIVLACASVAWLVWSQKGGGGAIKSSHADSHLYAILSSEVEDCSAYQGVDRDPIATLLGRDETSCVAVQEGLLFHAEGTKAQVRMEGGGRLLTWLRLILWMSRMAAAGRVGTRPAVTD